MVRSTRALTVTMLAAAALGICLTIVAAASSPAYAGAKPVSAWDPVRHTTADRTIHLYGYLRLVRNLRTETADSRGIAGTGRLQVRHSSRIGGPLVSVLWTSVKVRYRLTRPRACPEVFGTVFRRLFIRAAGDSTWHERPHYHAVVRSDCP